MSDKTIYVFDLDDTVLYVSPFSSFVDMDKNGIVDTSEKPDEKTPLKSPEYESRRAARGYFIKIKGLFLILFSKEVYFVVQPNKKIIIYDYKTKLPLSKDYLNYLDDVDREKVKSYGIDSNTIRELPRMFKTEDDNIIVEPFPGFYEDSNTIGGVVNEKVYDAYSKAQNKMILTGRKESLRADIEKRLRFLGVERPNYGLIMYTGSSGVSNFKNETIGKSIEENNWKEVHFFEDKKVWLDSAAAYVSNKFPEVKFVKHLISK